MKRISKSRVLIRPPVPGDCDAFLAAVCRSRAMHRNWISPKAKTRAAFAKYLKKFETGPHHGFLVIHRETRGIVGIININDVIRGDFQSASVGYYAFVPHVGQGLMREGLMLVLRHRLSEIKTPPHRGQHPANQPNIADAGKKVRVCAGRFFATAGQSLRSLERPRTLGDSGGRLLERQS